MTARASDAPGDPVGGPVDPPAGTPGVSATPAGDPAAADNPADAERRRFFRRFAGEVVTAATSVFGAAAALQQESADTARRLLGPAGPGMAGPLGGPPARSPAAARTPHEAIGGAATGFRTAFRWDDDVCRVVDQRHLPLALVDFEVRGVADAVTAIRDRAVVGAGAEAQVAAIALALTAARARASRPLARRATIRGGAGALLGARPGSALLATAVRRVQAQFDVLPDDAEGDLIAAALRAAAETIVHDLAAAHGAIAEHGAAALPASPDRALRVVVHGPTGTLGGGQFGTAVAAVLAAHHAERPLEVVVPELRPGLEGARVVAWELVQAGVRPVVVPDAAAPGLVAAGEADVVLAGADRISLAGDVLGTAGGYPLALAAARAGVPFVVCAPTMTVDAAAADRSALAAEEGRPMEVLRLDGRPVVPDGATARYPRQDVVPAAFVSALVTETGVLRAPYGPALDAALGRPGGAEAPVAG